MKLPALIHSLFSGLKVLLFHPMLYCAILLHWAVIRLPMPAEESTEPTPEELLEESVSITRATSFRPPPRKQATPPKPKPLPQQKQKPPTPQALALAKAEAPPVKKPEPIKPEESDLSKPKETEDPNGQKAESQSTSDQDGSGLEQDPAGSAENDSVDFAEQFAQNEAASGSEAEQSVGFNLKLLPSPELVFTQESIDAYQSSPDGSLEQQENVQQVDWLKNKPKAIAIDEFRQKYKQQGYAIAELEDYAGGTLLELQKDDQVVYASFINNKEARTLKSSTIYVIWKLNPLST